LLSIIRPASGTNALRIQGKHPCLIEKESPKLRASITMQRTVSLS
jgi:hypothetical protein